MNVGSNDDFELFVNGTLMRGLALHENIATATFLERTATEARYRLYSINDVHPGMFRLADGEPDGVSVEGELYRLSLPQWRKVEAEEPPNLYRGRVVLLDGRVVWGILYPRQLAERDGVDISSYGGWRNYIIGRTCPKHEAS